MGWFTQSIAKRVTRKCDVDLTGHCQADAHLIAEWARDNLTYSDGSPVQASTILVDYDAGKDMIWMGHRVCSVVEENGTIKYVDVASKTHGGLFVLKEKWIRFKGQRLQ